MGARCADSGSCSLPCRGGGFGNGRGVYEASWGLSACMHVYFLPRVVVVGLELRHLPLEGGLVLLPHGQKHRQLQHLPCVINQI